jgi:hypothetical protein
MVLATFRRKNKDRGEALPWTQPVGSFRAAILSPSFLFALLVIGAGGSISIRCS